MIEKYYNLIDKFNKLDISEKREELISNFNELLLLIATYNKRFNSSNNVLPILDKYTNEDEFLNAMFTYMISLKEELAKTIENIE